MSIGSNRLSTSVTRSCSPAAARITKIECPRPRPSAYRCASASGTAWRLIAVQLSMSLRLSRISIFGVVDAGSDQRIACGPCAISLVKGGDDPIAGLIALSMRRACGGALHRVEAVHDRLDARPVGV